MSVVTINDEHLKNIANAIRQKSGETHKYKPSEMANAIKDIPVGGSEPILQNITIKPSIIDQSFVADAGYDAIGVVNVSKVTSDIDSDIKASNIKKGVNILGVDGTLEEGIIPSGEIQISANGTYDVTNYASAVVEVEKTGGGSTSGKYAPRYIRFRGYKGVELNNEIKNLDTSNISDMGFLFYACTELTNLDLSGFDTSNTTRMAEMFEQCGKLKTLDVSSFDTSKVTSMQAMFYNCSSLTELDLKNFDNSNVQYAGSIFRNMTSLRKLDIRNFTFKSTTDYMYMFDGTPKNCLIIVKDDTQKTNLNSKYSGLTNVKTVEEYQAEGGE